MMIWIDAQLPPAIAPWIQAEFEVQAVAVRDIGLRDALDREIFDSAKQNDAVVMTKDSDFLRLLDCYGPPPQVLWITCGNTSNQRLREVLTSALPRALRLLSSGEPLVEISGK